MSIALDFLRRLTVRAWALRERRPQCVTHHGACDCHTSIILDALLVAVELLGVANEMEREDAEPKIAAALELFE